MRLTNLLCTTALALGALALVPAARAGAGGGPGTPGGPGADDLLGGHVRGRFLRPTLDASGSPQPGHFRARLRHGGETLLRTAGNVLPGDAPGAGDLHGVLALATPFGPVPVGHVHGQWQRTGPHGGTYALHFVAPPSPANPAPTPFGASHGAWSDGPPASGPGGPLVGHWHVTLP